MTRTGGSACEFTDPQRTLKADLNDLIVYQKINYPDMTKMERKTMKNS